MSLCVAEDGYSALVDGGKVYEEHVKAEDRISVIFVSRYISR